MKLLYLLVTILVLAGVLGSVFMFRNPEPTPIATDNGVAKSAYNTPPTNAARFNASHRKGLTAGTRGNESQDEKLLGEAEDRETSKAPSQLERFHRGSEDIEDVKELLKKALSGDRTPTIPVPTREEIEKRFHEAMERQKARNANVELRKAEKDAKHARILRIYVGRSKSAFEDFQIIEHGFDWYSPEAMQEHFNDTVIGAYDNYFAKTLDDTSDAEALSDLLSSVASFTGIQNQDSREWLIHRLVAATEKNNTTHLFSRPTSSLYLLNPDRQFGLWVREPDIAPLVLKWCQRSDLSEFQQQVLMCLIPVLAMEFGCDVLRQPALAALGTIESVLKGYKDYRRVYAAYSLTKCLNDLVSVILVGSSKEQLRDDLVLVRRTVSKLVLAVHTRKNYGKSAPSSFIESLSLHGLRQTCLKAVFRDRGTVAIPVETLTERYPEELATALPSGLRKYESEKLKAMGEEWLGIATLFPAIQVLDSKPQSTDLVSVEAVKQLLTQDENLNARKFFPKVREFGGHLVPAIIELAQDPKTNREILRRCVQLYEMLCKYYEFETPVPLISASDHRKLRSVLIEVSSRDIKLRYADRKDLALSTDDVWRAMPPRTNSNRHFSCIALYDRERRFDHVMMRELEKFGAQHVLWEERATQPLGWRIGKDSQPDRFAMTRDVGLAKRLLVYSVSVHCRIWQSSGAFMGRLMERMTGYVIPDDGIRINPRAWLELLNVKPDFTMYSTK